MSTKKLNYTAAEINNRLAQVTDLAQNQGDLSKLETTAKDSLVNAINEAATKGGGTSIDAVEVSVDANTGTPSATASVSGSKMTFEFKNLKGAKGETGAQGNSGVASADGIQSWTDLSDASAISDDTTSQVNVAGAKATAEGLYELNQKIGCVTIQKSDLVEGIFVKLSDGHISLNSYGLYATKISSLYAYKNDVIKAPDDYYLWILSATSSFTDFTDSSVTDAITFATVANRAESYTVEADGDYLVMFFLQSSGTASADFISKNFKLTSIANIKTKADAEVGEMSDLETDTKDTIVDALNEVNSSLNSAEEKIDSVEEESRIFDFEQQYKNIYTTDIFVIGTLTRDNRRFNKDGAASCILNKPISVSGKLVLDSDVYSLTIMETTGNVPYWNWLNLTTVTAIVDGNEYFNKDSKVYAVVSRVDGADITTDDLTTILESLSYSHLFAGKEIENKYALTYGMIYKSGTSYEVIKSGTYPCYAIQIKKGSIVSISAKNLTACRAVIFEGVLIENICPGVMVALEDAIAYDTSSRATFNYDYYCECDYATILLNPGDSEDFELSVDYNLKNYINNHSGGSSASSFTSYNLIHEFTAFDEDYSASDQGVEYQSTTSAEFYETFFDKYLGYYNGDKMKVTKKVLTKDQSDTYDIWGYDFCPKNYSKTILLSAGMHPRETPAAFGLAMWIRDLMAEANETFTYIKNNVRILVIPIVNVWGWNQTPKAYANCNCVNPNRNFDTYDGRWAAFPETTPIDAWETTEYKGTAPFSEKETQMIRDWLYAHDDAVYWIDCHTGVGHLNESPNYIYYTRSNPLLTPITNAKEALVQRLSDIYSYADTPKEVVDDTTDIRDFYATDDVGIPTMCVEQPQTTPIFGSGNYNNSELITEYATELNAYIVAMLFCDR